MRLWVALASVLLAGCVALTVDPRALIYGPDGVAVRTLPCEAAVADARAYAPASPAATAIDPSAIRIATWNIHKEDDAGWQDDLTRFAQDHDILLLQEVTLIDEIRDILQAAGMRWVMASSFLYKDTDIGVLTATRAVPVAHCTLRVVEPLIRLPKSSVVTWFPLKGSAKTLAVANVHSINFSLLVDEYEAQLAGIAAALAGHDGPIIFAGDLNTWTDARLAALHNTATRLRLVEIPFEQGRSRFLGREVDHILVRGLTVVTAATIAVNSSDHNPVTAVLRLSSEPSPTR
jgi:endonuclease/exonuclease/phosphatase (EEP) superfamily protein YafD